MHTRTMVWTALRRAKAQLAGWEQGRALRDVVRLFAAMLVCTLIARGASGAALAVVEPVAPRRAELVQTVTAEAVLSTDEGFDVTLPAGLTLTQMIVPAGGSVQAGAALAQFDANSVYEALAQAETELARLQLTQDRLSVQQTADGDVLAAAETRLARTRADRDTQAAQAQAEIERAQTALAQAEAACDAARAALDALRGQLAGGPGAGPNAGPGGEAGAGPAVEPNAGPIVDPGTDPGADPDATPAAGPADDLTVDPGADPVTGPAAGSGAGQSAGSDSNPAALAEAEAALAAAEAERARQAALLEQTRNAANAANETAARSVADAETARDAAARAFEDAQRETALQNRQNGIDAGETARLIAHRQAAVETLSALAQQGGTLTAPLDGTVESWALAPGGVTAGGAVVRVSPVDGRLTAVFSLPAQQAAPLNAKTPLTLLQGGTSVSAAVRAVSAPDRAGNVTVTADIPDRAGLRRTLPVTAEAELSRTVYGLVVPAEAVHTDSTGSYVLRIEKTQTVLGVRNLLARVKVTVLEQTADGVAVEGALTTMDLLAVSAARPIAPGDSVRVRQT